MWTNKRFLTQRRIPMMGPMLPAQGSPPHLEPNHVGDLHPIEEALDLGDPTASSNWLEGERREHGAGQAE